MQSDASIREQALDPRFSFIVQAPAGSGKTELLSQRFLTLLLHCQKAPEEIVAITFTRKAAAEMRERIIHALLVAKKGVPPLEPHKQKSYALAKKVLEKDQALNWHLLENPNRLRVMTIDALSSFINQQIPLLSGLGAPSLITENAKSLYLEAVLRLREQLQEDNDYQKALSVLLLHLDNHSEQLTELFMQILSKREQWLPLIMTDGHQLESALQATILKSIQTLDKAFQPYASTAFPLMQEALKQDHLPKPVLEDEAHWRALATLCMTKDDSIRKKVDKNLGFPPTSPHKKAFLNELERFANDPILIHALKQLLNAPPAHYTQIQWEILKALLLLLPLLVAQLHVIFQEKSVIDFTQSAQSALQALGEEEAPTDLALQLDYQIQHLLIDEFQDTSLTQFQLLEKLTAGWMAEDGRTLFLVGDPMQSIYRFREAEVGLFLRAKQQGIGLLTLIPLTLTQNFRSQSLLVDWVNETMQSIFPTVADIALGAVPYTLAQATQFNIQKSHIKSHALIAKDDLAQAQKISACIQEYQKNSEASIAILIRAKSHAKSIIHALEAHQIPYQAIDIEPLNQHLCIQDLLSLLRAFSSFEDEVAWLSILRAPWCGLSLKDLHTLKQHPACLWQSLKSYETQNLSSQAKTALARIVPIIQHALESDGQLALPMWLEGVWLGLGGPMTLPNTQAFHYVQQFFDLLRISIEEQSGFVLDQFTEKLKSAYSQSQNHAQNPVYIMTIHKAKGLEFDHVILPSLEKNTGKNKNQLLIWLENMDLPAPNLILAPIKATHEKYCPLYQYVNDQQTERLFYETQRLLYVAVTRAKHTLDLFFSLETPTQKPPKGSLLHLLWPSLSKEFSYSVEDLPISSKKTPVLSRFCESISLPFETPLPFALNRLGNNPFLEQETPEALFDRSIGIMIHTLLHHYTLTTEHWSKTQLDWRIEQQLALYPLSSLQKIQAKQRILMSLQQTFQDPQGQWILQKHAVQQSEYALANFIIDRWFIDGNTLWIIDYKTTLNPVTEPDPLHKVQLQDYAKELAKHYDLPIQVGLYFTHTQQFIHWPYEYEKER